MPYTISATLNAARHNTSHEIGHNFTAQHDGSSGFIMSASFNIASPSTTWSSTSVSAINTKLAAVTCLTTCVSDTDGDGVADTNDNCPSLSNTNQTDSDNDGIGDVCDNCPSLSNTNQTDSDNDGIGNVCDNCPSLSNTNQTDSDNDGIGDVCDNCPSLSNTNQTDSDNDGIGDVCDNCPSLSNTNQTDSDNDGIGNVCDNCPSLSNTNQTDSDNDGIGDVCDNCPSLSNTNQTDSDNDGIGDVCDTGTCINDTTLTTTIASNDIVFIEAIGTISCNSKIHTGATLSLLSENLTFLTDGFWAQSGSDVLVGYQVCSSNKNTEMPELAATDIMFPSVYTNNKYLIFNELNTDELYELWIYDTMKRPLLYEKIIPYTTQQSILLPSIQSTQIIWIVLKNRQNVLKYYSILIP
ncbi:MAG: thrombospondin type 3 repeat-containing protein [Sphingobacteriales bacterium]|nr:thrombospondin type 3 repeat-containing protein [Sphingobacteriales bacterium]